MFHVLLFSVLHRLVFGQVFVDKKQLRLLIEKPKIGIGSFRRSQAVDSAVKISEYNNFIIYVDQLWTHFHLNFEFKELKEFRAPKWINSNDTT